ncbi:MAG: hypothetical protein KA383_02285 [Phycisphaerae bacterium]|nr:hypothetical protein [Phycisphaerae bacterium]
MSPSDTDRHTRVRPRAARRWRLVLLSGACLVPVLLLGAFLALTFRPAWYQPGAVDRGRLLADKTALAQLQDDISAALNAGRTARFRLDEAQLNRWLTARGELWPELGADPEGIGQPVVRLADGVIRVAVLARVRGAEAIVELAGRVEPTAESIVVHCAHVRVGAVPIPRDWVLGQVSRRLARAANTKLTVAHGALRLANEWVWPNGKRRFRAAEIVVSAGAVEVALEPLGSAGR